MKNNSYLKDNTQNLKTKTKINESKRKLIYNIREVFLQNKLNFAIRDINKYIELYGKDCFITHELGKYYYKIGDYENAKIEFYKNIDSYSKNMYYSMYEAAKVEIFIQNYEQAEILLKNIINSNHKEKIHAKIELIKLYDEIDEKELELKLIDEVIYTKEFTKGNIRNKGQVFILLVQSKISDNQINEAEQMLKIYKKYLEEDDIKYLTGEIEICKENYEAAKNIFEDLIDNGTFYKFKASYELMIIEYRYTNYERVIELGKYMLDKGKYHQKDILILISNIYIKYHMFDEAMNYINQLKNCKYSSSVDLLIGKIYLNSNKYEESISYLDNIPVKEKKVYQEAMYRKMICYVKMNKLQEAYNMLDEVIKADYNERYARKITLLRIYLEKYLNMKATINPKSYTGRQIQNYDKALAIEHIKSHEKDDELKEVHTIFSDNINIEELYDYCLLNMNQDSYYNNTLLDTYILPYDNAGFDKDKAINYIKVVTIPNTNKILSIYPFDIHLKKEESKTKNKIISRIDKFNQKYGIK